ncbi:hypothetical protein [Gordonia sp. (in: high G+C Gram-positive bacteria)]|uniref:hypothetical protein n=1 Tax=Gordonia sp. (in: high G+C Gram-positive bacteria) TaxID=84139 RepID=UPI0039E632E6
MITFATGIKVAHFANLVSAGLASLPARPQPAIMGAAVIAADPEGQRLSVATYDWDRSTTATAGLPAAPEPHITAPVRFAVSGKLLAQVVKVAPKSTPLELSISSTVMTIRAGKTVFTLPVMDVEDFPKIPAVAEHLVGTIGADVLIDAVTAISVAAEKESNARTIKECVSLVEENPDRLSITALQNKVIATTTVGWTSAPPDVNKSPQYVLDVRIIADELLGVLKPMSGSESIEIHTEGGLVGLTGTTGDQITVTSTVSTFDMPYPAWRNLFERQHVTAVDVDETFAEAVRRAAAVAEKPLWIRFEPDAISLSVDGALVDEVAPMAFDGDRIDFTVNPAALREILATVGEPARLRFTDSPTKPVHISPVVGDCNANWDDGDEGIQCLLMGISGQAAR